MPLLTPEIIDSKLKQIPALPLAVMEALERVDKEEVNIGVLADIISKDPGLVTRILKLANSPFYGLSGQVVSVRDACVLLGIPSIRSVLIAAGVIGQFPATQERSYDRLTHWRHSFYVAVVSKNIAHQSGYDEEMCFTAGLLHDIGKLGLDEYFPTEMGMVVRYFKKNRCKFVEAEMKFLGCNHAEIGLKMAQRWRLPVAISSVIAGHHDPDGKGEGASIVDLVYIANFLAHTPVERDLPDYSHGEPDPVVLKRLNIDWDKLLERVPDMHLQAKEAFNLIVK